MTKPVWCRFYDWLRNTTTIANLITTNRELTAANEELRQQLIEQTTRADSLELTLAVARGITANAMRERDQLDGALDRSCRELARLKHRHRIEIKNSRLWITRCNTINVASN